MHIPYTGTDIDAIHKSFHALMKLTTETAIKMIRRACAPLQSALCSERIKKFVCSLKNFE